MLRRRVNCRVSTLDAHGTLLRLQAEFSGSESVLLGHARSAPSRQSRISWPKKGYPTRPDAGMCCSPFVSTRST